MPVNNKNNNVTHLETEETADYTIEKTSGDEKKPHIIRRNVEDYLAEKALKKRLIDIFDDDFLID